MAMKKKTIPPFPYDPTGLLPYGLDRLWAGAYEAPPQWFQDIPHKRIETPYKKNVVVTERKGETRLLIWRGIKPTNDTNNAILTVEWKPGDKGAVVAIALAQARLIISRKKDLRDDPAAAAVEYIVRAGLGITGEDEASATANAWILNAMTRELTTKGGSCMALGKKLDERRDKMAALYSGDALRTTKNDWTERERQLLAVVVEAIRSMMVPERRDPHTGQEITDRMNDLFQLNLNLDKTGKALKRLGLGWI